jgi:hypothetical protein
MTFLFMWPRNVRESPIQFIQFLLGGRICWFFVILAQTNDLNVQTRLLQCSQASISVGFVFLGWAVHTSDMRIAARHFQFHYEHEKKKS